MLDFLCEGLCRDFAIVECSSLERNMNTANEPCKHKSAEVQSCNLTVQANHLVYGEIRRVKIGLALS